MTVTTSEARVLPADKASISEAARLLKSGRLVAFPTETVYGLGADARDERALAQIFAVKARPRFNPLIVHVRDLAAAEALAQFHPASLKLAEAFWPGGLTLVLPRRRSSPIGLLASAGLPTVALRVPAHPVAQALLQAAAMPVAAPSANRSGRVSPTTAQHVAGELAGLVDLILDGGPSPLGIESTVIGFAGGHPVLLRPGAIAREEIEALAGPLRHPHSGEIAAPGMMASHYAPRADLRLEAREAKSGEAFLGFGPSPPEGAVLSRNLSPSGDLKEAAANLFAMLRALDERGAQTIAVMPIPHHGLGEAINDRLQRAAAPRNPEAQS